MGVCLCSVRDRRYTGRRSQGIDSGHSYLRSSKTPQVLSGCPVVADYHRLSVGNAHVSCRARKRLGWSARCRPWSVNPSRELRRFESFTCHRVRERASDLRKRGRRPSFYTWWGYRKRPRFGGHQVLVPRACDLRKRVNRIGRVRALWGMRTQVGVYTTVLAGLPAR